MGVKDLWGLVSPLGEVLPLTEMQGTSVAIDLAPWVVDSQNVNMGKVTRPHLRNLLWRTLRLLNAGVLPLFVLEGDAPSLKWNTISKRNQQNFGHGKEAAKTTVKTGNRSQFKRVQKECAYLLDLLGVPWVQAIGEAEATCAALNYHQVVSGVITQDSDVFLYGGETVFRNFTANQSKATVEKFRMSSIEEHLGVNRSGLLVLGLLLGCDYLPAGIPQVGKETAIRMIREWYQQGITDPLERICRWSLEDEDDWKDINPKKWKTGSLLELEAGVRGRALATDGFPFMDIIKEYKSKIRIPIRTCKWRQPQMHELMSWCIIKLDWEPDYTLEKIAPVVSRWIMMNISPQQPLPTNYVPEMQAVRCVKKCVRGGVSSMVIEWHVVIKEKFQCSIPAYVTTDEPITFINKAAPHLIEQFEAELLAKKKGKRSRKKKTDETSDNGISSLNLNTNVEAKKSSRKKPVRLDSKTKSITNYLEPKSKMEDITKEQIKELKSVSSNNENVQNQDCSMSLHDKLMLKQMLKPKECPSTRTNEKNMYDSSPNKIKNLSVAETLNDEYDMPSMNDNELAELSGMLRKLEMGDEHKCKNDLISNDEQDTTKSESPIKNHNLDFISGKEESFNNDNDFNESCDIDNISEIICRISEASFSEKDQNIAVHVNRKHPDKKSPCIDNQSCVINAKSQIQLKDKNFNTISILTKAESSRNNDIDAGKVATRGISKPNTDHKKTSYDKILDQEHSIKDEKNYPDESLSEISSDNVNESNLSSEQSNFVESSWEESDNDFDLSMIINRITGMKMVNNENSSMTKSAVDTKRLNIHKNKSDEDYVSDKGSSLCLKDKFETKIKNNNLTKINPETLENQEKNEHDFKNSTSWKYFAPISERQNIPKNLPHDKILSSQSKKETNSVCYKEKDLFKNIYPCDKLDTDTSKESANISQKHLVDSLKQQECNLVTAQNMATDIIRCSLKDNCDLSTFGNSMSDSILTEAAECLSGKIESLKTQTSFDLFENSCDNNINKQTNKDSSIFKLEDTNKSTTPNLPKHHSTPSVGSIAPRRILNSGRLRHTPNFTQITQGDNLSLPSPFTVSSPAQTSFVSDFGSPFTTLDTSNGDPICEVAKSCGKDKPKSITRNDIVNKAVRRTNEEMDTPVSSKIILNQVSNSKTKISLSSNDEHHSGTSEYQCKTNKIPKYKVKEENQICFNLLDSFDNSGLNHSDLRKKYYDKPSDVLQIVNHSPESTTKDGESMGRLLLKYFPENKNSQKVPEEVNLLRNEKEKRKPLHGLMNLEKKVDLFQNKVLRGKEEASKETENCDLGDKKYIRKVFMNLKTPHGYSQDKELYIKNGKENIESNIEVCNDDVPEKEKQQNLCSKYSDISTYSPVVPSQYISLADRLKANCQDKAMENLIDQLF